jgi:glycosyltransferase involved in cell wall biosynthesis
MYVNYVTSYDLLNREQWPKYHLGLFTAGTYIARGLVRQGITVENLGGVKTIKLPWTRLKWLIYRRWFDRDYYSWLEPLLLHSTAYQINRKLAKAKGDIVLCTENMLPICQFKTKKAIVLWTDTTLASLIDFYPHLSNLCRETKQRIYDLERANLQACRLVIFTSDWAAKRAIEIYQLNRDLVKVIPWGANLEDDRTFLETQAAIATRLPHPCKLLFVGVDWFRKGGDLAFAVAQKLNQRGIETELTVIGCQPPLQPLPAFVKVIGYLDTSTASGLKQFEQHLAASHFLVLPTQADCSPHALIEANTFGVPCLASDVGGIATIIKSGENGAIFPLQADSDCYCDYIMSVLENYERYRNLAASAFQAYQNRLNWQVSTQEVARLLQELL